MKQSTQAAIWLSGRRVYYSVLRSKAARKMRIRVGLNGVIVVQPLRRNGEEVANFLIANQAWLLDQIERARRLRDVRRPVERMAGEILFRGTLTRVRIAETDTRSRGNLVRLVDGGIIVHRGVRSETSTVRSLENWLRKQARTAIERHLAVVTDRLGQIPNRIYVMGQRTKWGNCSARGNLSFNWRLIFAPDFVLRYLVTHEAVHLAVPDHSAKFWLTVQSLCRETERAKQWLVSNQIQQVVDLAKILDEAPVCGGQLRLLR
jgi:predicted metal-dependent hydrolase